MHVLAYMVLCIIFNNLFCNEASPHQTAQQNPLLRAATNNDITTLQTLLDAGQDSNQTDADGYTALHWATFGNSYEAATILLQNGTNVDALNSTRLSSLFCANCKELKNFMQLYLTYGADFNQPERDTISLLKHLTDYKATDLMQELVNYGHWHEPDVFTSYQKDTSATPIVSLKLLALNSLKLKDNHDSLLKTIQIQEHYSLLSALVEYYTYYISFDKKLVFFNQITANRTSDEVNQLSTMLGTCHAQRYEKKWQAVKTQTSLPLAIDQSFIASNMTQSFNILLRPRPAIKDRSPTS